MDMNTIVSIVGSLGFPIAVCFMCFWYINKHDEKDREERAKMTEAINNNTTIVQSVKETIEYIIGRLNDNEK